MDSFRAIVTRRPALSAALGAALVLAMIAVASTHGPSPASLDAADSINTIPTRNAVSVHPRVLTAYGTLIATAVMGILYLYRRRPFILHWLSSFLLLAAALSTLSWLTALAPDAVVIDIALLCLALSAVMLRLAADSFPRNPVRPRSTLSLVAAIAAWSVFGAALLPGRSFIDAGMLFTAGLLAWAAVGYVRIARQNHHLGAAIIAVGLCMVAVVTVAGVVLAADAKPEAGLVNRLAVINVITSVFIVLGMLLLVFEEITAELRRANRDLESANESTRRVSVTDPLTGCQNRLFFEDIERREMNRHRRYGIPISVVFIDVNNLKLVNDTDGHERGDEALRAIGTMLRREVRQSDYVIRWGGDEFVLLLTCPLAVAQYKAIGLKEAFREECEVANLSPRLGLSVGVAEVTLDAEDLQDAIRQADAAMYRDKIEQRSGLQVR